MPKIDDPAVQAQGQQALEPAKQALQASIMQTQEANQANLKDMLSGIRDQVGAGAEARKQLEQLDEKLDAMGHEPGDLHDHLENMDNDIAEQLLSALEDGASVDVLAESLDQQTQELRDQLDQSNDELASSAKDPSTTDAQYADLLDQNEQLEQDLQRYESARAATEQVRSQQELQGDIEGLQQDFAAGLTAQAALDQMQANLEAMDLREEEERKTRISQEMTGGEIEFD
jgi:chromosome segregation ATPase